MLHAGVCGAQPLTPAGTTWTESPTPEQIIHREIQKDAMNRWKIVTQLQEKVFNIQENVTVNRARSAAKEMQAFDAYLNNIGNPVRVSSPKFTASGKVTTTPAPGTPTPSGNPVVEFIFRAFLFGATGSSRQNNDVQSLLWSSELSFTCSGYGEWTLFGESASSPFTALIEPGSSLDFIFQIETRYDATTSENDVRHLFESGSALNGLPELAFNMQLVEVPSPSITSLGTMAMLFAARRQRKQL